MKIRLLNPITHDVSVYDVCKEESGLIHATKLSDQAGSNDDCLSAVVFCIKEGIVPTDEMFQASIDTGHPELEFIQALEKYKILSDNLNHWLFPPCLLTYGSQGATDTIRVQEFPSTNVFESKIPLFLSQKRNTVTQIKSQFRLIDNVAFFQKDIAWVSLAREKRQLFDQFVKEGGVNMFENLKRFNKLVSQICHASMRMLDIILQGSTFHTVYEHMSMMLENPILLLETGRTYTCSIYNTGGLPVEFSILSHDNVFQIVKQAVKGRVIPVSRFLYENICAQPIMNLSVDAVIPKFLDYMGKIRILHQVFIPAPLFVVFVEGTDNDHKYFINGEKYSPEKAHLAVTKEHLEDYLQHQKRSLRRFEENFMYQFGQMTDFFAFMSYYTKFLRNNYEREMSQVDFEDVVESFSNRARKLKEWQKKLSEPINAQLEIQTSVIAKIFNEYETMQNDQTKLKALWDFCHQS